VTHIHTHTHTCTQCGVIQSKERQHHVVCMEIDGTRYYHVKHNNPE
jgi:hypothetical protein